MTKEKMKKKTIPKKIAVKRPRDHDDSAAIQVFEVQIHCLTLILFYLSQFKKTFDTFFVSRHQQNKNEKKQKRAQALASKKQSDEILKSLENIIKVTVVISCISDNNLLLYTYYCFISASVIYFSKH